MSNSIQIKIKQLSLSNDLPLPSYATLHSAGMDLLSSINENKILKPMERFLCPTGIAIALPIGYEAQIRSRSGLAYKNGIVVVKSPGTIDADYRGEVFVPLINFSGEDFVIDYLCEGWKGSLIEKKKDLNLPPPLHRLRYNHCPLRS